MNGTSIVFTQPLAYRIWEESRHSYFYTDTHPETTGGLERWTGFFDKQGTALYEGDIIKVHYDWRFGWVRARIVWDKERRAYAGRATDPDGAFLTIGFYSFCDGYRVGNMREHPGRLVAASEQFQTSTAEAWWLSPAVFRSPARLWSN